MELRKKIDDVIENSGPSSYYGFSESSFRHLDTAAHFKAKLARLDSIVHRQVFNPAHDAILPNHYYQALSPTNKSRKRRISKVTESDGRETLNKIRVTYDHTGKILTMNKARLNSLD
jgi:hypothetical protein